MSGGISTYKGMCPCGGDISWASWGADCRGNDGGHHIRCLSCGRIFDGDIAYGLLKSTHKWEVNRWVPRTAHKRRLRAQQVSA